MAASQVTSQSSSKKVCRGRKHYLGLRLSPDALSLCTLFKINFSNLATGENHGVPELQSQVVFSVGRIFMQQQYLLTVN